jgi:hypothetical protein
MGPEQIGGIALRAEACRIEVRTGCHWSEEWLTVELPLGDLLPDPWQATPRSEATPPAVPATGSAVPATTPLPDLGRCILVIRPYPPLGVSGCIYP